MALDNSNSRRLSDASAVSDKRFSETIASHAIIRATDKDVLNGIVSLLSADIKASNSLLTEKIKTLTENTLRLEKIVEKNSK